MDKYLNVFHNEIYTASRAFYTHLRINGEAIGNEKVYFALGKDAEFWNFVNHALVDCFYITLGRLFDDDRRSFSASRFVQVCRSNMEKFSLSALRSRRIASTENSSEWIDKYMSDAYAPTLADFDRLNEEVERAKEKFVGCKMIRHKRVAHADEKAVLGLVEITGAKIEDIKSCLFSLYQVYEVVWQYYHNGRQSTVGDHTFNEEKYVTKDVSSVLGKLVAA